MDFEIQFPDCFHHAFCDTWLIKGTKLGDVLNAEYGRHTFATKWPEIVENLLILLKLLPAKNGRKGSVEVFKKAIQKLIVFRKVNCIYVFFNASCQKCFISH